MDTTNHDEQGYTEFDFPEPPTAPNPSSRRRNQGYLPEPEYQGADDRVSFDDSSGFDFPEPVGLPGSATAPYKGPGFPRNEYVRPPAQDGPLVPLVPTPVNQGQSPTFEDHMRRNRQPRGYQLDLSPGPTAVEQWVTNPELNPGVVPGGTPAFSPGVPLPARVPLAPVSDSIRFGDNTPLLPEATVALAAPAASQDSAKQPSPSPATSSNRVSRINTPTDDGPDYELGWDDHGTKEGAVAGRQIVADWKAGKRPAGVSTTRGYRPIVGYVVSQAELDRLPEGTPYTTKHGKFGIKGAAPAVVTSEPNAALGPNAFTTPDTRYTMEPSLASRPAETERAPLTGDDYHRSGRDNYTRPMVSVYPQGNANELMNRFNTANTGNASTDPRRVAEMLANRETIRGPSILTFVNDEEDYTKLPHGAVYMSPGGVGKKGTGTGYIDMRGQFQPLRYGAANAGGVIAGESPVDGKAVSPQTLQETRRKVTQGYNVPGQGTGKHGSVQSEQFTVVSTEEARRKLPLGTAYITPDGTMAIRGTGLVTLNPEGFLVASTVPDPNQPHPMLR